MGECGCASTDLVATLPAPDGATYGLEVYPGCNYCDTPVFLFVHKWTADDPDRDMFLDNVTELPLVGWDTYATGTIAILDPADLATALRQAAEEGVDMQDPRPEDLAGALIDSIHARPIQLAAEA